MDKEKKIEIIKDVTILNNDNEKQFYPALLVNDIGVYYGRLLRSGEFIETGFIPAGNIQKILGGEKIWISKKEIWVKRI